MPESSSPRSLPFAQRVAALPEGQRTRDVSTESAEVAWMAAREAIAQADAGELALMPPTYLTSLEVGGFDGPDAVLAAVLAM